MMHSCTCAEAVHCQFVMVVASQSVETVHVLPAVLFNIILFLVTPQLESLTGCSAAVSPNRASPRFKLWLAVKLDRRRIDSPSHFST